MRSILVILFLLVCQLSALAGKPLPFIKVERLYQTDKNFRRLVFIEFDNHTGKVENDYLKKGIPKALYTVLKNNNRFQVTEEDLVLSWKNFNKFVSNNYKYTLSNGMTVVTPTNDLPKLPIYFINTNIISDQEYHVAYLLGASNTKYINARFDDVYYKNKFSRFNANNPQYLKDFEPFNTSMLLSNEMLYTNYRVLTLVKTNVFTNYDQVKTLLQTNIKTNAKSGEVTFSIETNTITNYKYEVIVNITTNTQTNYELLPGGSNAITNEVSGEVSRTRVTNGSLPASNAIIITVIETNISTNYDTTILVETNIVTNKEVSLFIETNDYYRNLEVKNGVISVKTNTLPHLLEHLKNGNADFAVYGQLRQAANSDIELKIFLIRTKDNSIELIYKKIMAPEKLFEEIAILPRLVLGSIQKRDVVNHIYFNSSLSDTFVYINNQFIGKTPLTIFSFPVGEYNFDLWHPDGDLDVKRSTKENKFVISNFSLTHSIELGDIVHRYKITIDSNLANSSNYFYFREKIDAGTLKVTTDKGSNTVLHVNSELKEQFNNTTQFALPTGEHFLILSNEHFETVQMLVPVKKDLITEVQVRLQPHREIPKWKKPLYNYDLNTKIFGGIGGTLFLATLINYLQYNDSILKRETLRQSGQIDTPAYDYINEKQFNEVVSLYTVGTLAAGSLLATLISRILHIKSNVSKISWEGEPRKSFKIKFSKRY